MDPSVKHSVYGQSSEMPNNMYSYMNEEYATPNSESIADTFGIIDGENSSGFPVYQTGGQLPFGEINYHHSAPLVYDSTTASHPFHHNPPNLRMDQEQEPHTHRGDESAIVFHRSSLTTTVNNQLDGSSPHNVPSSFADVSEYLANLPPHQASASQPSREVNDHLASFPTRDEQTREPFHFDDYIHHPDRSMEWNLVGSDINMEATTLADGSSTSAPLPTELNEKFSNMHLHLAASPQQPCKEVNVHPSDFTSWDRSITQAYPSDRGLPNLKIRQQSTLPYACLSRESPVVNAGPSTSTYVHEEPLNNSQIHKHSPYLGSTGDHAQGLQMNCDVQQNFFSVEQNWEQMFPHFRNRELQRNENAGEFLLSSSLDGPVQTSSNLDQKHVDRNQALQSSNLENLEPIGTGEKPFGYEKKYVTQPRNKMKPHQCKICKKLFRIQYKWVNHMRDAHDVENPFECDICHRFFSTSSNLYAHKRSVHDKVKALRQCDICQQYFFSHMYQLEEHKSSFHGAFECE